MHSAIPYGNVWEQIEEHQAMTILYKLTDKDGMTRNNTQWGVGVTHSGTGEGEICTEGWIHAYETAEIALFMYPFHISFYGLRLWQAEGDIAINNGLKVACKTLTTIKEISIPDVTTEMRVEFGIRCSLVVCKEKAYNKWANRWLAGIDRGAAASAAASDADAAYAAYAAAYDAASAAASAAASDAAASALFTEIAKEIFQKHRPSWSPAQ